MKALVIEERKYEVIETDASPHSTFRRFSSGEWQVWVTEEQRWDDCVFGIYDLNVARRQYKDRKAFCFDALLEGRV